MSTYKLPYAVLWRSEHFLILINIIIAEVFNIMNGMIFDDIVFLYLSG